MFEKIQLFFVGLKFYFNNKFKKALMKDYYNAIEYVIDNDYEVYQDGKKMIFEGINNRMMFKVTPGKIETFMRVDEDEDENGPEFLKEMVSRSMLASRFTPISAVMCVKGYNKTSQELLYIFNKDRVTDNCENG